jgi:hypothetical protein
MSNPNQVRSAFLLTRLEVVVAYFSVFKMFSFEEEFPIENSPPPSRTPEEATEPFAYGTHVPFAPLYVCDSSSKESSYKVK